ncbi:hypothetical protein [Streptomyces sp. KR80]|uniref:hypothetical protein n=1 Tax=Streptomyces sp. KR80 TaxID=3457426 RepID=UPI003FD18309
MIDFVFVSVPGLMAALGLWVAARTVLHHQRLRAAWGSGLTAEARCLRAYTTTSRGGEHHVHTTQHHVYEFTDRAGRTVRFEEQDGPGTTVEGDVVVVHYPADRPERATAVPPHGSKVLIRTVLTLAFLSVFIGFCVFFAWSYLDAFAQADDAFPDTP